MDRTGKLDEQTAARLDGQKQLLTEARARRDQHGSYATYGHVEVERHQVAAPPQAAGSMHVNLDELHKVADKLTDILGLLRRYQTTADRLHVLSHRLRDGQGPVSESMRALFTHRAGQEEGLSLVLRNYERALLRVREEIRNAERRYRQAEEDSVRSLQIALDHLDTAGADSAKVTGSAGPVAPVGAGSASDVAAREG